MIDIDLLVQQLRDSGHAVDSVIPIPENAGECEFILDGGMLSLSEARLLLERDQNGKHVSVRQIQSERPLGDQPHVF